MPLVISDEILSAAGLSEGQARVGIVCHWFDEGKLTIGHAARLLNISEFDFEVEIQRRGIPRYRYTDDMLQHDVEALQRLGRS